MSHVLMHGGTERKEVRFLSDVVILCERQIL